MLIALNVPDHSINYEEFVAEMMKDVKGKINIYMPRTWEDWFAAVKKSRPKKTAHTVLLAPHYRYVSDKSEGVYRMAEYLFQSRGGSVWGEDPGKTSLTYAGTLDDPELIVKDAHYKAQRALFLNALTSDYVGRTESDPHTLIVNYAIDVKRPSKMGEWVLESLPNNNVEDGPDEWWEGVGFMTRLSGKRLEDTLFWLENTNIVTLGDEAHRILTEMNVPHGALPAVKDMYKPSEKEKLGIYLRETAHTGDDNRGWKL